MNLKSFEEIKAWKGARELTRQVYALTRREPFAKDFGMRDQVCRAEVSIMSNIAEGYESQTEAVFIRYLGIAKGSAGELRSQLYVALDQGYATKTEFSTLADLSKKVSSQIARLKSYLESSKPKSHKTER